LLCCCRRRLLFFLPCLLPVHYSLSTHIHGAMAAFDLNVRLEEDDDDGFDLNNGTVTLLCLASCRPCLLMAMLLWFAFPCFGSISPPTNDSFPSLPLISMFFRGRRRPRQHSLCLRRAWKWRWQRSRFRSKRACTWWACQRYYYFFSSSCSTTMFF
jgi:hypothetical protein